MSKTFRPWAVDDIWLLPPSVQDFVPAGHAAHLVRDLVRDELDLSAILSVYTEMRGYPPYHPGMMVALLLYAYSQGVYASRRIARACEERLDFQAVTALNQPDFRTISDFRKRHLEALAGLFSAGAGVVPPGWTGRLRPCRARRHQDQGQCLQAQGDELCADEQGRGRACRRNRDLAGARRSGGWVRGCHGRRAPAWR